MHLFEHKRNHTVHTIFHLKYVCFINGTFTLRNMLLFIIFIAGYKAVFFLFNNKDFRRVVNYLLMELEEECVIIPQNSEMYIGNLMPTCV